MQAAGFVLAGGRSSRMGRDKALLELDGVTLVELQLRKLREVCAEVAIAGGSAELESYGRVLQDEASNLGPLSGIVAGLAASRFEWNLFVAVDVPLVPLRALRELIELAGDDVVAVLTETEGRVNPLCGVYSRRALPVLRRELTAGRLRVRAALEAAGSVRYWRTPVEEWFRNVNTPEEFAAMQGSPRPDSW